MARKLYDSSGRWVALDDRHAISPEHIGAARPQWVFRFCGDFVSAHPTKRAAEDSALQWEMARVSRMTGA